MKPDCAFARNNRCVFLGMFSGLIIGYMYWAHFGMYDGTFYFSSEWWANCVYGALFGGLLGCLIKTD